MAEKRNVVTGATGLLGSHVVERLIARGEQVVALVRPSSDVSFLRELGVELACGDLHDIESIRRAVAGADIVYHCAAKVGDWGPWSLYQREIIDNTRNVLEACRAGGVGRVLHVSSVTVYGHPRLRPDLFTEDEPLGQNLWRWEHYCRSKIQAEELVRRSGIDVTIVRPSWIYGPRDRNSLPRLLKALRAGRVRLLGSGDNLLNLIYAADVAEGAILAANHPGARGQAYNLSSEGDITQRDFLNNFTDALALPRVTRRVPFALAFWGGYLSEMIGRLIRIKRPPHITRYAVTLVSRTTRFSIAKARAELGWQPQVGGREGIQRSLAWLRTRAESPLFAAAQPV